jgi:hypothetical protein
VDVNVQINVIYYYTVVAVGADGSETPIVPEQVVADTKDVVDVGIEGERGFILMQLGRETMVVNGDVQEIDPGRGTVPIAKSGRTLLPIAAVVGAMGGSATWIGSESRVDIFALGHRLEMWIGRTDMTVNGAPATMDVAPEAINGRTMLPVRFVADNIGCHIEWIGSTQEVVIVYPMG